MRDSHLLDELLNSNSEDEVLRALNKRNLLSNLDRWRYLGDKPNNQSVVYNQQSSASAALVEKYTNAGDALLLRRCRAAGIDPRGDEAPRSMSEAVGRYFGDMDAMTDDERRSFAEENIVLFATGSKARPCLAIYDNGEGQLAQNFPTTFCSLIFGSQELGSYKGAIDFVQGRFNMGGTGVLSFCSEKRKLQLIVSRVPEDVAHSTEHEWAFTLVCFFPDAKDPSWRYLVGEDNEVLTAGSGFLNLLPRKGARAGRACAPRERAVDSGTLIKMYDFEAPRSNVCGELFKKLGGFLIQPALPLRIIECRDTYKAKVMGVTLWNRLAALVKSNELEEECEEGVGFTLQLKSNETVGASVRVFKLSKKKRGAEVDEFRVGLRALINGQSHAKRGSEFFRTKRVSLEHIARSMLITLDCTRLGQQSRNDLFMANRETFRDSTLRNELFEELQEQLKQHPLLRYLNQKRYEEKVKNAVNDEDGLKAMEDLLSEDPDLAELFGSQDSGKTASKTSSHRGDVSENPKPEPFKGVEFPTFFHRQGEETAVDIDVIKGGIGRVSFMTDVRNNYFTRTTGRGSCSFAGDFAPSHRLYNGRLTFTCRAPKTAEIGSLMSTTATITDPDGSGPFELQVNVVVVRPESKKPRKKRKTKKPKGKVAPSRPRIIEVEGDVTDPPIEVNRDPKKDVLEIHINTKAQAMNQAKAKRPPEEAAGVAFVFKYGLALIAMAMIDQARSTRLWIEDEAGCRENIGKTVSGLSRVIVPLCLHLPKKLPKIG